MFKRLVIIEFACWIAGFFVSGFNLYNILLIIPVIMFCVRKDGIHVNIATICGTEFLLLFFTVVFKLIFRHFDTIRFILTLVVRAISIIIVIYDDTHYIYVNKEYDKDGREIDGDVRKS